MGDVSVKLNDIKLVENFSFEGCRYEKAEDDSVARSCDQLRADTKAKFDTELEAGVDPKRVARGRVNFERMIVEMEGDKEDTLKTYNRIIGVQESIVGFFSKWIDDADSFDVEVYDSDDNGVYDGMSIEHEPDMLSLNVWPGMRHDIFQGMKNRQAFAGIHHVWLYGEDFAPFFSSLLMAVQSNDIPDFQIGQSSPSVRCVDSPPYDKLNNGLDISAFLPKAGLINFSF